MFIGEDFLKMLDEFYGRVTEEEFMAGIHILDSETIDKIAAGAARLHGKGGRDILDMPEVLPQWYSYGKEVDEYVRSKT